MQESGSISGVERQELIADFVNRKQRASIAELCETFGISEATARRDLETLDEQGLIRRVHGGAIPIRQTPPEMPILQRSSEEADEKRAKLAGSQPIWFRTEKQIFLGSGSTVLEMARALRGRKSITVLTNSLPVVNELADAEEITLAVLGGMFRPSELSFIGHITEQALTEVLADKVFIGIRAIDVKEGLTNAYVPETMTDRAILKIGREIIVLADHTKCDRVSTVRLAPISSIHALVTSKKTPHSFIDELRQAGLRVIQA
jgi:DeoR family transcriptional regulator, aga operon transcriptional repressor